MIQMVDGNGYGTNWEGLYDPEVIDHYGRAWRADGSRFSETVKLVLLAGGHAADRAHGRFYAMARNLAPRLRAAYDEALARYDVLVMPTLPSARHARP
jgi:amidase